MEPERRGSAIRASTSEAKLERTGVLELTQSSESGVQTRALSCLHYPEPTANRRNESRIHTPQRKHHSLAIPSQPRDHQRRPRPESKPSTRRRQHRLERQRVGATTTRDEEAQHRQASLAALQGAAAPTPVPDAAPAASPLKMQAQKLKHRLSLQTQIPAPPPVPEEDEEMEVISMSPAVRTPVANFRQFEWDEFDEFGE
ncbi:hypothetical protein LTS02_015816 [Friedmanniomyces endolithicus]|nr:hypothetical protein LTS02_015816 [Friedmanniomyces endolithicus]